MSSSARIVFLAAVFLAGLIAPQQADAFAFNGYRWLNGTDIVLHLQLVRPPVPLQDGSASWDASAANALNIWNTQISTVRFVQSGPSTQAGGDGMNSVFFSNSIYGDPFPTSVLAVTVYFSNGGGVFSETDVIFNNLRQWNSYRGPQQGSGASATYDLRRVALHEFGHVLGLDHPDQNGQAVVAIMNSVIGNLDNLAQDDIDGARSLYGLTITSSQAPQSVLSGSPFNYQITAANNPSSYSATGLPPGIQVNTATGLISGSCPTSGVFTVSIVVQGALGRASGQFVLTVVPLPLTSSLAPPGILIGNAFSYQITAGNNPTSFTATNLPQGLTLNSATGLITGTPTSAGYYIFTVTANGPFAQASGTIALDVRRPAITSQQDLTWDVGDSVSYQITVTHPVTSYSAEDLPAGVHLNPTTGLITGTATPAGDYFLRVHAQTAFGEAYAVVAFRFRGPYITSPSNLGPVPIGEPLVYQITANRPSTSFSAIDLPAGLQLNSSTGRITGAPSLSGYFPFQVISRGANGDATGYLFLIVIPQPTFDPPAATVPLWDIRTILADPVRPRLYIATGSELAILDSTNFAVTGHFSYPSGYVALEISTDGATLYLATGGDHIRRLDLNTLQFLPDIITPALTINRIKEGSDGRLYATASNQPNHIRQLDLATGDTLMIFAPPTSNLQYAVVVERSPDHSKLFVWQYGTRDPVLARYGLSAGDAPTLEQSIIATSDPNGYAGKLSVSPDGGRVVLITSSPSPNAALLRSANNLTEVVGTLSVVDSVNEIAFSRDGLLAIASYGDKSRVDVCDVGTGRLLRTITLPDYNHPSNFSDSALAVNNTSSHFFFSGDGIGSPRIYAYSLDFATFPPPRSLLNVSSRLRAQTNDNVLIGGFIITGNQPKKILARAIGPSLLLPGSLADPFLELHNSTGALVARNDNWNEHRLDVLQTGAAPADEHESAIVATLQPGRYTAILRGRSNTSGVALVELYDLQPGTSRIANISTRGKVETGDNVMIGGFIISAGQPTRVIVRAIGPSLSTQNVTGALADTTLSLHDANGTQFAANDDWQSDQAAEIIASTIPPTSPRESAIVRTLQPGRYTAIVRGKNNTTGVALVEVYNLEN